MAVKGTLGVGAAPGYGDKKAIETFKGGSKPAPISGANLQAKGPGRPQSSPQGSGSAGPQGSSGQGSAPAGIPPEHAQGMKQVADADEVRQFFAQAAARFPNPWTEWYAQRSSTEFEQIAKRVYDATPNFE